MRATVTSIKSLEMPVTARDWFHHLGVSKMTRSQQDSLIELAQVLLGERFKQGMKLNDQQAMRRYFMLDLANELNEIFGVLYLDSKQRFLGFVKHFRGSVSQAPVYPRVIAEKALALNATAVILVHNHPHGILEPSTADELATSRLIRTLKLIEVQVIDHFIVGLQGVFSFKEKGLI